MLTLGRRKGESIHVGHGIIITVLALGPKRVKLCIEAPRSIPIVRAELIPDHPGPLHVYTRRRLRHDTLPT